MLIVGGEVEDKEDEDDEDDESIDTEDKEEEMEIDDTLLGKRSSEETKNEQVVEDEVDLLADHFHQLS